MPRGAPDYSNVRAYGPLHRADDHAELATRLKSPVAYDRGGSVVWMTSFESGLQGTVLSVDTASSTGAVSSARACHGCFSVKMDPSSDENSYVYWNRIIHFLLTGKLGGEFAMSLDTDPLQVRISMFYRDGTNYIKGALKYWPETGNWEIQDSNGDWVVVLEDHKLQQGPKAWHPVKLVIDVENEVYVRALITNEDVDLSDYGLYKQPDSSLGQLEVRVTVWGDADTHAPIYLDSVIVTQNEPPQS